MMQCAERKGCDISILYQPHFQLVFCFLYLCSCSIVAPGPILCVYSNPDTSTAIVQLTSGEVWKISPVDLESFSLTPWELDSGCCLTFGEHSHCEKMELAFFNGKVQIT